MNARAFVQAEPVFYARVEAVRGEGISA